ncbi:hypothetical protein B4U84_19835 [Westiellopsis prolifica IICB1]|nr:hypothetical protein B4U84_19835 [Westiellopsis prolifica IICB1]
MAFREGKMPFCLLKDKILGGEDQDPRLFKKVGDLARNYQFALENLVEDPRLFFKSRGSKLASCIF